MQRRYITVDVFTDRIFGGNPLAVVLDAGGLSADAMQAIAAEFNYSETTFVLPPRDARHTARVHIFTPRSEVPFAGHPNVGTGFVLARERRRRGERPVGQFLFEEAAGVVPVRLLHDRDAVVGAELCAPEPLSRRSVVPPEVVARCLALATDDVKVASHAPQVASVGLPFVVAELASRDSLRRSRPVLEEHERLLPLDGADGIFVYWRQPAAGSPDTPRVLHARMYAPVDGVIEDPATGSATAALIALLAELDDSISGEIHWQIHQGVDMGRPSQINGRTTKSDAVVTDVRVGGQCVLVMEGNLLSDRVGATP